MKAKTGKLQNQQAKDDGPKALLLKIGKIHFLKHGAKGLSVRKVASEAGVNLGSFVYYFETKEKFVREIILEFIKGNEKLFEDISDQNRDMKRSMEDLKSLIFNFLTMSQDNNRFVMRMLTDALEGEYGVWEAILSDPPQPFVAIRKTIAAVQERGQLRKDVAPELIHLFLLFSLALPQFVFAKMHMEAESENTKEMINKILDKDSLKTRIDLFLTSLEPEKK